MILEDLKQHTHDQHIRLEKLIDLLNVEALDQYRYILERFYGFYCPVEYLLASVPEWSSLEAVLGERRKSHLLRADLIALGYNWQEGEPAHCTDLPVLRTTSEALGCLYVLEGATLGGQVIVRHLQKVGPTIINCCTFFNSYGADVGPMWKQFRQQLLVHATSSLIEAEIVGAAGNTFEAFERWLRSGSAKYRRN